MQGASLHDRFGHFRTFSLAIRRLDAGGGLPDAVVLGGGTDDRSQPVQHWSAAAVAAFAAEALGAGAADGAARALADKCIHEHVTGEARCCCRVERDEGGGGGGRKGVEGVGGDPAAPKRSSSWPSPLPHSLTDSLPHSLTHWLPPSLTHSLTHLLTHSLTLSLSHSLAHSLSRSLTHSTRSLTQPLPHSPH